jgi:hypothetical protein
MLVAIVMLLLFLSSWSRVLAALVGGAGFGAFIDELGKFVTSDNDYFFKPTPALLYVAFVVLFLATRQVRRFRSFTPEEKLVNAIELLEKLAAGGLSRSDRTRALDLLAGADQRDPLVPLLRERFLAARSSVDEPRLARFGNAAERRYAALVTNRWFQRLLAAIFILEGIGFVLTVLATAVVVAGALLGVAEAQAALSEAPGEGGIATPIELVAGAIAGSLVVVGVARLRTSRARAYHAFELAILVDLLLAKPFAFLALGFVATIDVAILVALLVTLRYLQSQERLLAARRRELEGVRAQPAASPAV